MEFNNLEEINTKFKEGKFEFPPEMMVAGIAYKLRSSSTHSVEDMLGGKRALLIYTTAHKKEAKAAGLEQWVVFAWGFRPDLHLVPLDVKTTAMRRAHMMEANDGEKNENHIGDIVEIKITNLPASSIMKGKVDTGATICSLHAEKWKVDNNAVKFVCPELSPNVISVPLVDQQAVKSSDGGTEYRPVITLNIKINGKMLNDVQFNLNDRGQMEFPILVGQNALEKGKFLINPRMNEEETDEIDWEVLQEEFKDSEIPEETNVDVDHFQQMKDAFARFDEEIKPILKDFIEK